MNDVVISVENLSKQYRIGGNSGGYKTLRESLVDVFKRLNVQTSKRANQETIWALKDVSFEVQRGEVVGIIGRNGAGKSTLLKILSRITKPTEGRAVVRGRVGSLLEVGTGFHAELTGRENIYLNGAVLGMRRAEIERKFDEIVDFAEIEQFLETPVKYYSSGMYMRLAFAVAAHLEPEILLVDEVLAVGDIEFQKKCLGKMGEVAGEGRTVLFVSHNLAAIENLCRRAIVLDHGLIKFIGTPKEALSKYQRRFSIGQTSIKNRTNYKGSGEVKVVGVEFRDIEGHAIDNVACGQDFDIVFYFETLPGFRSNQVIASFSVKTQWGTPVFLHHNRMTGENFGELPSQGAFICRIRKIPLTPSTYKIGYSIQ